MPPLSPGHAAPPFTLRDTTGRGRNLVSACRTGPLVLFFFRHSCPTAQLMAPYLTRLAVACPDATVWTITRDSNADATRLAEEAAWPLRPLLDLDGRVHTAYGIETFPTTFLIRSAGLVDRTLVAFDKAEFNGLATRLSDLGCGGAPTVIAPHDDGNPAFRPG